jgi:hypothetical protein
MTPAILRRLLCLIALWLSVVTNGATAEDSRVLARALLDSTRDSPFPQQWAAYQVYAYATLDQTAFQRPYQDAINRLPVAVKRSDGPWLAPMQMRSVLNRFLSTPQGEFIYVSGCKPRCCGTNVGVVFDPATGKLALLLEKSIGTPRAGRHQRWLVGDYTPTMAALLEATRAAEKSGYNRLPLPAKGQAKAAALLAR